VKLDDTPKHAGETVVRELSGEVFIVHLDTSELHGLNEVGSRIWTLVDGERRVSDIVDTLLGEYDVDRGLLEHDVLDFLDTLAAKDLIGS
jgi:hypothetical protein